jgi:phasin family protein
MATARKTAAKKAGKTARKSTRKSVRRAAPKAQRAAAGPAGVARSAAANAQNLFDMSMAGFGKTLEHLNLSGVAGTIAEGRRKDLAALVAANKKSYEGIQAVVARQTAMLRNAVTEWQAMAQGGRGQGMGRVDEIAKQTFTMALENIRELGELAARSQAEAFEIVRRRIMENVEEVNALMRRGG